MGGWRGMVLPREGLPGAATARSDTRRISIVSSQPHNALDNQDCAGNLKSDGRTTKLSQYVRFPCPVVGSYIRSWVARWIPSRILRRNDSNSREAARKAIPVTRVTAAAVCGRAAQIGGEADLRVAGRASA